MANYKPEKVSESLQSPQAHEELLGDGQQLKRQTSRSRSAGQQSQGVFKPGWWVFVLWSRYTLGCSSSWLHTVELARMSYSSLAAHTQQYYSGDNDAIIHPDVIPTWILNVGLGTSSTCSIQSHEAQLISMSWNPISQKTHMRAAWIVTCTGHLLQNQWSNITGLTFHKFFWKCNLTAEKGIYYLWFKIQLTSLNSRDSILSK